MSPTILTAVSGTQGFVTAGHQKKENVAERVCDTMLEAIDDVQNEENPVDDDEDQVDYAFRVPKGHVTR